jgi:hypothetical protein
MAEKEYTVVAPDGKEITLIGPVGATQEEVIAQAQKLYNPKTKQVLGSNIINTDVPTVVSQTPRPEPKAEPKRTMMDRVKALYEVPLTVGSAAIAGPVSSAYGVYKSATSPQFGTQQGVQVGQQAQSDLARRMTYTPTSPVAQEFLQDVGQVAEAAKLPPIIPTTGMLPSYARMASTATPIVRQNVVQPVSQAIQAVPEVVKTAPAKVAEALRRTPSETEIRIANAPSSETLAAQSNKLFNTAQKSGVEIDPKDFANNMKQISRSLEDIGYDAELYPDIAIVMKRLENPTVAKDFNKLKALRTMIGDLQGSQKKAERKIATQLKNDFDDYLASIPESSIVGGTKEGLAQWKEARDTYNRLSKSQIFEDMLERAETEKTRFSMSGSENSLTQQLRQLANNPKKMRMFTPEEQQAIIQAARGGNVQNLLRYFGKFAPTGPVSSIVPLLTTAASAPLGLAATAGAMGARVAATKIRKSDVNKLAALMRAGAKKPKKNLGAINE